MSALRAARLLTLSLVVSCAVADEPPDRARGLTGTYSYVHTIREFDGRAMRRSKVTDTLRLSALPRGALAFDLRLIAANGHTCELEGVAEDRGEYFEYSEKIKLGDEVAHCVLRIRVSESAIRLEDVEKECRLAYCGMRARIDGASFPR